MLWYVNIIEQVFNGLFTEKNEKTVHSFVFFVKFAMKPKHNQNCIAVIRDFVTQ